MMFKIGEFSKLSMLTVKALRFYEKQGLLIPAEVDRQSGCRFYTFFLISPCLLQYIYKYPPPPILNRASALPSGYSFTN